MLVTGHTGFKGSWLALWLESMGAQVTGFSRSVPSTPSLFELARVGDGVERVEGDVADADAVAEAARGCDPEVVLHLAAQPIVRRSYREPAETFAANVTGTVNVLDAARAAGSVRAVVVVTSDKCYDNRGLDRGYREDEPLGGSDPYSASKACQEIVAHAYRRSFDMPVATGRAGNVIGGGDFAEDRLVPDVLRAALAGEPVSVRNPAATRPWQHVLEPLSGYLTLAERVASSPGDHPPAVNFGPRDDDERPVGWIVDRLAELWPGGIERVPSHEEAPPPEANVLMLDSSLAASALGWTPAWDLGRGLEAVVEWFAAYRDGADMRQVTLGQIAAHQAVQCAR
ncbi:MAG: CDP-glucose 4,6-dehydratase [Thermoleophilaceae bacterium]|nr:CDP-glucose 4,6-dehydratase [Thermoleophilaceae bacterium]